VGVAVTSPPRPQVGSSAEAHVSLASFSQKPADFPPNDVVPRWTLEDGSK